jgi:putative transposase
MPVQKYKVALGQKEVDKLKRLIGKGVSSARIITRARVLLMANENGLCKTDKQIRESLQIGERTPHDVRERYNQGGLKRALYDAERPGKPKIFNEKDKARVCAIACTNAPDGHERWTLDLLREEAEAQLQKSIGRTKIYTILLQNKLKPWEKKDVVYSKTG